MCLSCAEYMLHCKEQTSASPSALVCSFLHGVGCSTKQPLAGNTMPVVLSSVLHAFRLRLLKLLLGFGSASIILVWLFEGAAGQVAAIDRIAYPLMIVVFVLCGIGLILRPKNLVIFERLSFATF